MTSNQKIISFTLRGTKPVKSNSPDRKSKYTPPTTSLALVLRAASPELQPARVAVDLFLTGSSQAARPIWNARVKEFKELLAQRRLPFTEHLRLIEAWRAAIGAVGIELKARRQAERSALLSMLDTITI